MLLGQGEKCRKDKRSSVAGTRKAETSDDELESAAWTDKGVICDELRSAIWTS